MEDELKSKFIDILTIKGWNVASMRDAASSLGLDPEYHHILFPDGISEALNYYEENLDAKMLNSLKELEVSQKIREKIALALEIRIVPGHIPSLKSTWLTADVIWRFAGDVATDFNHYTKRTLLSGVYIAAAKYRANDDSPGASDTKLYIAEKLDQIINIAQLKRKLPKLQDIPIIRYFM